MLSVLGAEAMILVDDMSPCLPNRNWRYRENCHLFCDGDLQELHAFAVALGLRLEWFQNGAALPHYDLTRRKREQAVRAGAVPVDRQRLVRWVRIWRAVKKANMSPERLHRAVQTLYARGWA